MLEATDVFSVIEKLNCFKREQISFLLRCSICHFIDKTDTSKHNQNDLQPIYCPLHEYGYGLLWLYYRSRNPRIRPLGSVTPIMWHPLTAKVGTNLADKRRSVGRSVADSGHEVMALPYLLYGPCTKEANDVNRTGGRMTERMGLPRPSKELSHLSWTRPALRCNQLPIQWVPGG
jgi:hypothetical protein